MAYEQKDMSFSAFKNTQKKNPKGPDYSGTALINGKQYFIDFWPNKDKNGNWWFSGKLKAKDGTPNRPEKPERDYSQSDFAKSARARQQAFDAQAPAQRSLDDDVPFAPEFR